MTVEELRSQYKIEKIGEWQYRVSIECEGEMIAEFHGGFAKEMAERFVESEVAHYLAQAQRGS